MRFSPAAIALSLTLVVMSSASISKKADNDIDPQSIALVQSGEAAAKAGDLEAAINWFETSLAVDPRNRDAYLAMARAVRAQGLNGKAIRFYKEALELDPNNLSALAEQADAMIAKGAFEQAKKNIARLETLCRSDCGAVDRLSTVLAKASTKQQMQASAVDINPVAGELVSPKAN
ncbi:MAG: tetratricopeptide repeat protein [Sphingorhabdus sp.]